MKRKEEYNVVFNLLWKTNWLLVRTKYFNPGTSRAVVCMGLYLFTVFEKMCHMCEWVFFFFCWDVCMGLYVFIFINFVYYILLVFLAICRTVIGQLDFTKTSWPYLIYSHCFMYDILLSLSLTLTLSLHSRLPTLIFNLIWMVIINALDRCSS